MVITASYDVNGLSLVEKSLQLLANVQANEMINNEQWGFI